MVCLLTLNTLSASASWSSKVLIADLSPNTKASTINGLENVAPTSTINIKDDTNIGLSVLYNIDSNFQIEMFFFPQWDIDITPEGLDSFGISTGFAKAKALTPTIILNYITNVENSDFSFYAGAGITYTKFDDIEVDSSVTNALPGSKLRLSNSTGAIIQLGVNYDLTENMFLSLAYSKIYIDTSGEITNQTPLTPLSLQVDINPNVLIFGLGYKF